MFRLAEADNGYRGGRRTVQPMIHLLRPGGDTHTCCGRPVTMVWDQTRNDDISRIDCRVCIGWLERWTT